ncbi:MAG: hypothetical protein LQ344_003531 [Seirophora lacunosa]|nr:MAG: hypothetical protein LQ344_003531 [Seirophora lacunosa]
MGAWGYGLFQSNSDLDVLADISADLAKLVNESEIRLYCPEDPKHVAAKLNGGAFHKLLSEYKGLGWKHGVILLGAATMWLCGYIAQDDMHFLRATLQSTPMTDQAKAQMEKGLEVYKNNGEAWDFGSKGLHEIMMESKRWNRGGPLGGVLGMNVFQNYSTMAQRKPR